MKLKTVQQNQINNEIVKLRTLINLTDENIDDDLLIMIAKNLDKEWESFLKTLGITKQYIHFIMKLNKHLETNIDNFDTIYDCLRNWVLNQLKFNSKVFLLKY